ncbi:MAG: hypothetical protein ACPGGK_12465 [Pikeienuella sp.]
MFTRFIRDLGPGWMIEMLPGAGRSGAKVANRAYLAFWAFTLCLILVGSSVWVYQQVAAPRSTHVQGVITGLPKNANLTYPDGEFYQHQVFRELKYRDIHFIVENNEDQPSAEKLTFHIDNERWSVECISDFKGKGSPKLGKLKFKFNRLKRSMTVQTSETDFAADCEPFDADDSFEPAGTDLTKMQSSLSGNWFSISAFAQDTALPWRDVLQALSSSDRTLSKQARDHLARNFDDYREQSYGLIARWDSEPVLSRHALWALSRSDPFNRDGLFNFPDFPENVWRVIVQASVSSERSERLSGRRVVASYPSEETRRKVEEVATELGYSNDQWFLSLLRHFDYNRGVLIALAIKDDRTAPPPAAGLASLDRIQGYKGDSIVEATMAASDHAKASYGKGFLLAVCTEKAMDGCDADQAKKQFQNFLDNTKTLQNSYRYPSHIQNATTYLEKGFDVFR